MVQHSRIWPIDLCTVIHSAALIPYVETVGAQRLSRVTDSLALQRFSPTSCAKTGPLLGKVAAPGGPEMTPAGLFCVRKLAPDLRKRSLKILLLKIYKWPEYGIDAGRFHENLYIFPNNLELG